MSSSTNSPYIISEQTVKDNAVQQQFEDVWMASPCQCDGEEMTRIVFWIVLKEISFRATKSFDFKSIL